MPNAVRAPEEVKQPQPQNIKTPEAKKFTISNCSKKSDKAVANAVEQALVRSRKSDSIAGLAASQKGIAKATEVAIDQPPKSSFGISCCGEQSSC